ncbi:hypothetical protein B0J12DRAFT_657638 [Macrophomina phaseolina]|uniref:Complex 1 LYR protein domain-containing protein n=1 Tax=Macrophomina phaseolina TaxID=35725 RepID=A0ABQ8GFK8_9PEZI|nr:hypothetical protein B0J12DRAFT_657638 [Macrophomina phaseolina]
MPKFVVPSRSGAHRVAAIALYRALLTQCAAPPLPLADDQRSALRNIVRNKFRRNRHLHSARLLKLAFTTGYELLDTLDQASCTTSNTNNPTSYAASSAATLLTSLLTTAPAHLTRAPRRKTTPARLDPSPEACPPPAQTLLATRPRPSSELGGSGIRQVPRLVSANLFPMLRVDKPQPRSLSRVLTDKVKQRQRRMDLREKAGDTWAALGREEDEWDRIVWEVCGVKEEDTFVGEEGEGGAAAAAAASSWATEPLRVVKAVTAQLGAQRAATEKMVARMQGIVDKERELKHKEREERRAARERKSQEERREKDVEDILGMRDPKKSRPI